MNKYSDFKLMIAFVTVLLASVRLISRLDDDPQFDDGPSNLNADINCLHRSRTILMKNDRGRIKKQSRNDQGSIC